MDSSNTEWSLMDAMGRDTPYRAPAYLGGRRRRWALGGGVVALIVLTVSSGVTAVSDTASSAGYSASSCTPVVANGCAGYFPSWYAPPDPAPVGGLAVLAVLTAICAFYLGRAWAPGPISAKC